MYLKCYYIFFRICSGINCTVIFFINQARFKNELCTNIIWTQYENCCSLLILNFRPFSFCETHVALLVITHEVSNC